METFEKNINKYLTGIIGVMFSVMIGFAGFFYATLANRVSALEDKEPGANAAVMVAQNDIENIRGALNRIDARLEKIADKLNIP